MVLGLIWVGMVMVIAGLQCRFVLFSSTQFFVKLLVVLLLMVVLYLLVFQYCNGTGWLSCTLFQVHIVTQSIFVGHRSLVVGEGVCMVLLSIPCHLKKSSSAGSNKSQIQVSYPLLPEQNVTLVLLCLCNCCISCYNSQIYIYYFFYSIVIIFDKTRVQVHGLLVHYQIITTTILQGSGAVVLFYNITLNLLYQSLYYCCQYTSFNTSSLTFLLSLCQDLMDHRLREIGSARNVRMLTSHLEPRAT